MTLLEKATEDTENTEITSVNSVFSVAKTAFFQWTPLCPIKKKTDFSDKLLGGSYPAVPKITGRLMMVAQK